MRNDIAKSPAKRKKHTNIVTDARAAANAARWVPETDPSATAAIPTCVKTIMIKKHTERMTVPASLLYACTSAGTALNTANCCG